MRWTFLLTWLLGCATAGRSLPAVDRQPLDAVVRATYDTISGPAGGRDWDRFRALFAPGARLVPAIPTRSRVLTVEEFIAAASQAVARDAFYERGVASRIEIFGNIAHVFSSYESRRAPAGAPFARGVNSFQLVRDDAGKWRILTILWDEERAGNPWPDLSAR